MKKADRRRLKEQGINPSHQLRAIRKIKEGYWKGRRLDMKEHLKLIKSLAMLKMEKNFLALEKGYPRQPYMEQTCEELITHLEDELNELKAGFENQDFFNMKEELADISNIVDYIFEKMENPQTENYKQNPNLIHNDPNLPKFKIKKISKSGVNYCIYIPRFLLKNNMLILEKAYTVIFAPNESISVKTHTQDEIERELNLDKNEGIK
jgi:hypothetical protein